MKKSLKKIMVGFLAGSFAISLANPLMMMDASLVYAQSEITEDSEGMGETVSVTISDEEEEAFKSEPAAKDGIKLAYNGGVCTAAPGVAMALGFFEEEGLHAEIANVANEYEAVGTGQADLANGHIATELVPIANGVNATTVTGAHTGCKSIFVRKDSGIQSTKDLEGKTVALPAGVGSADQNIVYRFLKRDGIDPTKVKYKQVETGAALQAMEKGEVDAAILTDSFVWEADEDEALAMIRSLSEDDDFNHETCCATYMNNDFLEKNPVAGKKATRAIQRARQYMHDHPEETVDLLFEKGWATGDKENTVRFLKSLDFTVSDEVTEETIKTTIKDYKEFGFIREDLSEEDVLKMAWTPQGN